VLVAQRYGSPVIVNRCDRTDLTIADHGSHQARVRMQSDEETIRTVQRHRHCSNFAEAQCLHARTKSTF
jgi:hypothetical protein